MQAPPDLEFAAMASWDSLVCQAEAVGLVPPATPVVHRGWASPPTSGPILVLSQDFCPKYPLFLLSSLRSAKREFGH